MGKLVGAGPNGAADGSHDPKFSAPRLKIEKVPTALAEEDDRYHAPSFKTAKRVILGLPVPHKTMFNAIALAASRVTLPPLSPLAKLACFCLQ